MGIEDMENMRNMSEGDRTRYEFNVGGTQAEHPEKIKTIDEERIELYKEIIDLEKEISEVRKEIEEHSRRKNEIGQLKIDIGEVGAMNPNDIIVGIQKEIKRLEEELSFLGSLGEVKEELLGVLKSRLSDIKIAEEELLVPAPERNN